MSEKNFHICTIDDCWQDIDTQTGGIKESFIKEYISADSTLPSEPALKTLMSKCLSKHDIIVTAYSSPNFLLRDLKKGCYYPDFLVVDWDFGGSLPESETIEKKIHEMLDLCPVDALIFSAKFDDDENIQKLLKELLSDELFERVKFQSKTTYSSQMEQDAEQLINTIKNNYHCNSGYKLYMDIQQIFRFSTQKVFAEIFRFGFNNYLACIKEADDDENIGNFLELIKNKITNDIKTEFDEKFPDTSLNDLLDFIMPRIINEVNSDFKFQLLPSAEYSNNHIWNHRLYGAVGKNIKTGTILKKEDNLYLVLTRECDLACFFKGKVAKKTDGKVLMVKLENHVLTKREIKDLNSLTDLHKTLYSYILLCINIDGNFSHYKCNPRNILIHQVSERSEGGDGCIYPLTSDDMNGYVPVCTLNQPFLNNLIMSIFNYNMGYGVPNYTKALKESLLPNPEQT